MDEDISRLKTTAVGLLSDMGCNGVTLTEDLINEMCRFGGAELHAVAAFIGGIASQEVIKVLYFPPRFTLANFQFSVARLEDTFNFQVNSPLRFIYYLDTSI